jgi:hypothetical protein
LAGNPFSQAHNSAAVRDDLIQDYILDKVGGR